MKVVFVLHNIYKSLGIEWLTGGLLNNEVDFSFILLNEKPSEMEAFLQSKNIPFIGLSYQRKSQLPSVLVKIYRFLRTAKPDIVHTHLRDADLLGLTAAFLARVPKRIYTRHSSTFNHLYHKKSVRVDKFINAMATDIIAISGVTRQVLINLENVSHEKVTLIHHGFDLDAFANVSPERINNLKVKYPVPGGSAVIGVFARYTEWKGYQYIIPALGALKKKHPHLYFIFANTVGEYANSIQDLLKKHLPAGSYTEIRFESDIQALYHLLDIYVHTPIDNSIEAFGQTYVEALAAGVPSVFTKSGVANEFITDGENALVVDYKNSEAIVAAVERLLSDSSLCEKLTLNGKQSVKQFNLDIFIRKHVKLYTN